MEKLTRKSVSIFYFWFIEALPYIGPKGLHPALRMEWQLHPDTVHHLQQVNAMDADGSKRIMGVEIVSSAYNLPGHLKLALVSQPISQ